MSAVRAEFDAISIHTPLAGSDDEHRGEQTLPTISIHTPLAGSDDTRPDAGMVRVISIHTPLAGSDLTPTSPLITVS